MTAAFASADGTTLPLLEQNPVHLAMGRRWSGHWKILYSVRHLFSISSLLDVLTGHCMLLEQGRHQQQVLGHSANGAR